VLLQCCGFERASHASLEKSLEKAQRGAKLEFAAAPLASKKKLLHGTRLSHRCKTVQHTSIDVLQGGMQ
jgi:hypothetical protein